MLDPIVKTIEVPCSQERAFKVFVNEMDTWWPLGKFTVSAMAGLPAQAIRIEPRVGGHIEEIGPDGTAHLWGTFNAYDPYHYISMDFHIPRPEEVVTARTLVEVRFTVVAPEQTRVELTQSRWEALGEWAAQLRGGYGGGWAMIFESAYREACRGQMLNTP